MALKESSDELNPTRAITSEQVAVKRGRRSLGDYLALALATCGVGYLPVAPGTWGSLLAIVIYFGLQSLTFSLIHSLAPQNSGFLFSPWSVFLAVELVLITIVVLTGIWAATRTETLLGRKDPGKVVIDEVAGQLIALLPIVRGLDPGWLSVIAAFLLFRLFDIIKPYPARRLESLESGLGIMADDLVAGAYAAVGVSLVVLIRLLI